MVLLAAISTYLIPLGQFETEDVTYKGKETRTVLIPDSFEYVTGDGGAPETENVGLFASGGDVGILNYVFAGLVSGDEFSAAVC